MDNRPSGRPRVAGSAPPGNPEAAKERREARSQAGRFLLIATLLFQQPASTAVIVVDEVNCTLADAIESANEDAAVGGCTAGSGTDEIQLTTDVTLTTPRRRQRDPSRGQRLHGGPRPFGPRILDPYQRRRPDASRPDRDRRQRHRSLWVSLVASAAASSFATAAGRLSRMLLSATTGDVESTTGTAR